MKKFLSPLFRNSKKLYNLLVTKISALKYYLQSIVTIFTNFNWWSFPLLFVKKPILIKILNNPNFYVSNLIDIWTLKEVVVDKQYEAFKKIKEGDTIIDVGAAIGDFSICAAKKSKECSGLRM